MKKILRNPIVAVFLVGFALFYMYWNVLRPIMGWDNKVSKYAQVQAAEPSKTEDSSQQENLTQAIVYDSNAVNNFTPDWVFRYTRDPFKKQKRKQYGRLVDLREKPTAMKSNHSYRRYQKKKNNNLDAIQAVSIGPKSKLVLINGETIQIDDTPQISQDTVKFKFQNKPQEFIFQPKANQ